MSQIHKGIFAALAIATMFGAVQLAFAHDLIGGNLAARPVPEPGINRAAKADRAAVPSAPGSTLGQSQTISLRPAGLTDTSVLVRVPIARQARNETADRPSPPAVPKSGTRKTAVACEPVVSVLTEVAKLLEPGRCVT
jgi:hypothetical protein